ncbi:MAG: NADH-quinone oxidoreductase subunit D [Candidatus Methylacidiphilales bacterium]|nr:NADH-quinone oxidoreductase subunit D [Candidatus Methylacidiphilales bacterium]
MSTPEHAKVYYTALDLETIRVTFPNVLVEQRHHSHGFEVALMVPPPIAPAVARFLRDSPAYRLDHATNVTGTDYLELPAPAALAPTAATPVKPVATSDAAPASPVPASEPTAGSESGAPADRPAEPFRGFEVTYHLGSVVRKLSQPILLIQRAADRVNPRVTSLTSVYRGAELQEREILDLFGVQFDGHPDPRRLLMWEEFTEYPMRRDYVPPSDYEWEPTPHGQLLEKLKPGEGTAMVPASTPSPIAISTTAGTASKPGSHQVYSGSDLQSSLMEIALGPQHPSTHGVFRMDVTLDGETVVRLKPVFGYLHRNHEKLAENLTWLSSIPYTDRLDYFCSLTNNWAYVSAVEKLAGMAVPERAEHIRVIMAELTRLVNHVALVGFLLNDLGAIGTPLLYALREREHILDLFEQATGARMMCNFFRFGGCRTDLPAGWLDRTRQLVGRFPRFLDEFEKLLTENEIVRTRTQRIGILHRDDAINASITGPCLRASGVDYDLRKVDNYGIYSRFNFRVPLGEVGDCYDRFMLRLLEMRESLAILNQVLAAIPEGPVAPPGNKMRNFKVPAGEIYSRIESPKGELGFHLISDGTLKPYRYRVRPPSLINLTLLEGMCLGHKLADAVTILGSIDIVLGEVDR